MKSTMLDAVRKKMEKDKIKKYIGEFLNFLRMYLFGALLGIQAYIELTEGHIGTFIATIVLILLLIAVEVEGKRFNEKLSELKKDFEEIEQLTGELREQTEAFTKRLSNPKNKKAD